jgi:rhamnose transport system ATP-binding protein
MLLKVASAVKSFAGVQALKGVSFELAAGEVHALVGENGAGKSTLIKIVTGAHRPDAGTIEVNGAPVENNSPLVAKSLGIAAIYQQPALFAELSIAENLALGVERGWRVDWKARRENALRLLSRVGADLDPALPVRRLSMPQQQLVEIARALGANAKILIMDEPTSSLSEKEVANLFRVIRELKSQGVGVVYISHRLDELFEIADRVTVLRDGQNVGTRAMTEIDRGELIRMMVGRALSTVFPKRSVPIGETVLEVPGSFSIRAGEIFGLAGLVGSGRTRLAKRLFGLIPGEPLLAGIESPQDAVARGIAYVPEDRRRHGVIPEMSVAQNTTLASLKGLMLDLAGETRAATNYVERFAIKTPSIGTPVENLSGGNQQKVSLARWLATSPRVLILDEPTQGIDVGAKSEIHKLMGDLAEKGMAILMISSELPEILGMSDRIGVMHQGRIAGILERDEATPEKIMALALGHMPKGAYVV